MTQFATAQELRTYLTGETLSSPDDDEWEAQADFLLSLISADIQTAARNRIIRGTETAKLAGTWSPDLVLPRRPVVSIAAISLNGQGLAVGAYSWNDRSVIRSGVPTIANLGPLDNTAHWGGPVSTIEVEYTYGYEAADVPDVVKSLALRIAGRTIDNTGGVSQESLGPYSVSYGNVLAAGGSHVTDREAKMIRKRFSRTAGTTRTRTI